MPTYIAIWFLSIADCRLYLAVRGMMYYRRALKLQAFLDMATEKGETWLLNLC